MVVSPQKLYVVYSLYLDTQKSVPQCLYVRSGCSSHSRYLICALREQKAGNFRYMLGRVKQKPFEWPVVHKLRTIEPLVLVDLLIRWPPISSVNLPICHLICFFCGMLFSFLLRQSPYVIITHLT